MIRDSRYEAAAKAAAEWLRKEMEISDPPVLGLVAGTGWDVLTSEMREYRDRRFGGIPGMGQIGTVPGHNHTVAYGKINGRPIVILRGRVHLHQGYYDPKVADAVRLQTEMLFHLGVRKLVVTSAVGSLPLIPYRLVSFFKRLWKPLRVGDVVVVKRLLTLFAPPMPLNGEFCSPEYVLSSRLQKVAMRIGLSQGSVHLGTHAMVAGPWFETLLDKIVLACLGADVVGMSMFPELSIASLYDDEDIEALGLTFVTNGYLGRLFHGHHIQTARDAQLILKDFLLGILEEMPND